MADLANKVAGPPALRRHILLAAAVAAIVLALAAILVLISGSEPPSAVSSAPPLAALVVPKPPAPVSATVAAAPTFDLLRVDPKGDAVIAGRATPNATVTILDGTKELGQVTASDSGQFVFLPDSPLAPGGRLLSLSARMADGAVARSEGSVLLLVPARTPQAEDQPPAALAVLTSPNAAPLLLTPVPNADPAARAAAANKRLGLDVIDYDDRGAIRFTGSAPPGSAVRLYVDNHPVGDATPDILGRWTLTPPDTLSQGTHRLRLDQLTAEGRVVGRVEQPFQRVKIDPARIGKDQVLVQPGQNLWSLARVVYGSGTRYTVIFQANRDQIRDPRLIYPGQAFSVPASGATLAHSR